MSEIFSNGTNAMAGSGGTIAMASLASWAPLLGLVLGLICVIGLLIFINESFYFKLKRFFLNFKFIKNSLIYFQYGLGIWAIIGFSYGVILLLVNEFSDGFPYLKWLFIGVILYVITCFLGIPLKKLVDKIKSYEKEKKKKGLIKK